MSSIGRENQNLAGKRFGLARRPPQTVRNLSRFSFFLYFPKFPSLSCSVRRRRFAATAIGSASENCVAAELRTAIACLTGAIIRSVALLRFHFRLVLFTSRSVALLCPDLQFYFIIYQLHNAGSNLIFLLLNLLN